MIKNYFMSYYGVSNNKKIVSPVIGSMTIRVEDSSLGEIGRHVAEKMNFKEPAVILSMRELSDEEYEMLSGYHDSESKN